MLKKILNKIEEYQDIVIYRHINPDYDAFGSQYGMYYLIKDNFPGKSIYLEGQFISDLVNKFSCDGQIGHPDFIHPTLGIVLDTANRDRIDGESFYQCSELIKIDHHIVTDSYGQINYEDPSASSCSQMVGEFLKEDHMTICKEGANALYMGIIGDTNRFMYSSTDQRTFDIASRLYMTGINIQELYERMYLSNLKELNIHRFILNHFFVDENIGYYVLKDEDLKELDISREMGSNYVNILGQIKEFDVWMAITENIKDHNWRVSLRSRHVPVNEVANQYRGGGHMYAAGATLLSLEELNSLIKDLKEVSHV